MSKVQKPNCKPPELKSDKASANRSAIKPFNIYMYRDLNVTTRVHTNILSKVKSIFMGVG